MNACPKKPNKETPGAVHIDCAGSFHHTVKSYLYFAYLPEIMKRYFAFLPAYLLNRWTVDIIFGNAEVICFRRLKRDSAALVV